MAHLRVVRFPLNELWDEQGPVIATRQSDLGINDLKALFSKGRVRFVVADVGQALDWVDPGICFAFWKDEVRPRIIEPSVARQGIYLESLPGGFGYLASEWHSDGLPVVLLQKFH